MMLLFLVLVGSYISLSSFCFYLSTGYQYNGLAFHLCSPHKVEDRTREIAENDGSGSIKLDAATQAHIEKHR